MCYAHFLSCCTHAQIAAPVQPLSTVSEAPFQPAGTLVKLTNKHQQFVGGGIDSGSKIDDIAIEFINGEKAVFG